MPRFKVTLLDQQTNKTHEMVVGAENRIQAGGWARTRWATQRGEDYDPNIHKVLDIVEVETDQAELF